jgi:hypothetical protein
MTSLCSVEKLFNLGWSCSNGDTNVPNITDTSQVCAWKGIKCDSYYQILSLDLSFLNYQGTIPSEISTFNSLTALNVSGNSIQSPLPLSLLDLPYLTVLDLSNNDLNARQSESSTTDSRDLLMSSLSVTSELFDTLSSLKSLQYLDISNNGLNGEVPESLCNLPLQTLILVKQNNDGTQENAFTCAAACIFDRNWTLVISPSTTECAANSPTTSPTDTIKATSSESKGRLSDVAINAIIAVAVIVTVCCCGAFTYYYYTTKPENDSGLHFERDVDDNNIEYTNPGFSKKYLFGHSFNTDNIINNRSIVDLGTLQDNHKHQKVLVDIREESKYDHRVVEEDDMEFSGSEGSTCSTVSYDKSYKGWGDELDSFTWYNTEQERRSRHKSNRLDFNELVNAIGSRQERKSDGEISASEGELNVVNSEDDSIVGIDYDDVIVDISEPYGDYDDATNDSETGVMDMSSKRGVLIENNPMNVTSRKYLQPSRVKHNYYDDEAEF